ncbi:hypothetical protein P8452_20502 [Trifolium repens]|nr:hypothetical protein P8452_20502 [Trifolium repens]
MISRWSRVETRATKTNQCHRMVAVQYFRLLLLFHTSFWSIFDTETATIKQKTKGNRDEEEAGYLEKMKLR